MDGGQRRRQMTLVEGAASRRQRGDWIGGVMSQLRRKVVNPRCDSRSPFHSRFMCMCKAWATSMRPEHRSGHHHHQQRKAAAKEAAESSRNRRQRRRRLQSRKQRAAKLWLAKGGSAGGAEKKKLTRRPDWLQKSLLAVAFSPRRPRRGGGTNQGSANGGSATLPAAN